MMAEKKGGRRTVRRWVVTGTNPEGTEIRGWRDFDAGVPPTLDEHPIDGQLTRTPPRRLAGTTQAALEKSRRNSRVVSGTEKSLPKGDRD